MARAYRIRLLFPLAIVLVLSPIGAAEAAWVTVKNDTNRVIVVQSAESVKGQLKRGKPVRLLPGESIREFHSPPAITLEVFDAQNPNKPLLSNNLSIKNENQAFSVGVAGAGVVVTAMPAR